MKIQYLLGCCLLLLIWSCEAPASSETATEEEPKPSLDLDLDKAEDNLKAFMKIRSSLNDNEEVIFTAKGDIYGFVDGERDKKLLGFEMFNIAKAQKQEDGSYNFLTREVGLYLDPETDEILEEWENPYTGETVEVFHVWNDPVNQKFALEGRFGAWGIPWTSLGEDVLCMNIEVFLMYPSPLPVAEFPRNSRSDDYEAGELFQFFFSKEDVNNPDMATIPSHISWTRMSPWLPWMEMGPRPGYMVYQTSGYKIMGEKPFEQLPQYMQDYVMEKHPEYATAPDEFTRPNETSWTYFKKQMAERNE